MGKLMEMLKKALGVLAMSMGVSSPQPKKRPVVRPKTGE